MKYDWKGDYHEGLAKIQKGKKFGFVDENDKLVIPCNYREVGDFSEGLAFFLVKAWHGQDRYGYMDKKGVTVIAPNYNFAKSFTNGLAWVCRGNWVLRKGKPVNVGNYNRVDVIPMYIDKTGRIIYARGNIPDYVEDEIHRLPEIKTEEDAIEAVRNGGEAALYYVPDELKTAAVCMEAVKAVGNCLRFVPENLKTAELCMEAIRNTQEHLLFEELPDEFKNQEFMLEALKHGYPMQFAKMYNGKTPGFKRIFKTHEMLFEAVKADYFNMESIPEHCWTYEMHLERVKQFGTYLLETPKEFITPELCLEAVKPNTTWRYMGDTDEFGIALKFVPEEFVTEEMCLLAVQQCGYNLHWAPLKFRTKELCEIALYHKFNGFDAIPHKLLTEEWCYDGVVNGGKHFPTVELSMIPEEYRSERVCLEAAKHDISAIHNVPEKHKTKEFCLIAIKKLWRTIDENKDRIPADYWNDEDFCMEAIKRNFHALHCVPDKIKTKEFCLEAFKYAHDGEFIKYVPKKHRTEELCVMALQKSSVASKYVPEEIKKLIRESSNRKLLPQA